MALPECGIYQTGVALEGREEAVPAGVLIYFHNHSNEGAPLVLLPAENVHNKWLFSDRGFLVQGDGADAFLDALVPLPKEGFYVVREHVHLSDKDVVAERTLLQIGYTRAAEPILFPARPEGNGFSFSDKGFKFANMSVFERLDEAGFDAPQTAAKAESRTLH